jgi:hypothetical protein
VGGRSALRRTVKACGRQSVAQFTVGCVTSSRVCVIHVVLWLSAGLAYSSMLRIKAWEGSLRQR